MKFTVVRGGWCSAVSHRDFVVKYMCVYVYVCIHFMHVYILYMYTSHVRAWELGVCGS